MFLHFYKQLACFLFFVFALSFVSVAQNLFVVLAADGSERKHNGHYFNQQRLMVETDTIAAFTGFTKTTLLIDETMLTRRGIDSVLAQINASKQDVILFYLSGSEYLLKSEDKHIIRLKDDYLEVDKLHKMLKAKNAKFTLLLVDLCNTISTDRIVSLKMQPASKEKYVALFTQTTGDILALNHFAREQHELITTVDGTIFTNGFLHALHENRPDLRWESTMSRAKYLTVSESAGKQNPQIQLNLKNKEAEPQNLGASSGSVQPADERDKAEKIDKNPQMKTNAYNGNFTSPTNSSAKQTSGSQATNASQSSQSLQTKGGSFEKKSDTFVEGLSKEQQNVLSENSLATVQTFQDKIAQIAAGSSSADGKQQNETELIESAMLLFADNTREIGISSVKRGVVRKKVKRYFLRLYGIGNAYKIAITFYQPTEIEPLQPQTDGNYTTVATMYQEFRKTNKAGKLVYADRVTKKVFLTLVAPKENAENTTNWKIQINDIQVVEGSTEEIKE
jgi:hypothetical protein